MVSSPPIWKGPTNRNADTLSVREAQLSELERTVLRVFGGAHLLVSETYKLPS